MTFLLADKMFTDYYSSPLRQYTACCTVLIVPANLLFQRTFSLNYCLQITSL